MVTGKSESWPREPQFNGFFTAYDKLPSKARKIVEPVTGAVIRYSVSRNRWDEKSPRIRKILASATTQGESEPSCWLSFDLLESGRTGVSDDDFWYACDALSAPLERLASGLIESCDDEIGDVLDMGPILHFERLEVKQSLRGTGLGIRLSQWLLGELVDRFSPALLVLCPYPLQFENCGPGSESGLPERARYDSAFRASKRKLARLYEREFGVVRLRKNSDYWGVTFAGHQFMRGRTGWVIW